MSSLAVTRLRTEHAAEPLGLGEDRPRFSWEVSCDRRGGLQVAYRVIVESDPPGPGRRVQLWDSGWVPSAATSEVAYGGDPLASRERGTWTVEVEDDRGERTSAGPATFELGLLAATDWVAAWVGAPSPSAPSDRWWPSPYLRREFALPERPVRARLHATALGLYRAFINGTEAGTGALRPGWTDYHRRIQHQTYDVTDLLHEGDNAIGIVLGPGWACGHVGTEGRRQVYGDQPLAMAQLEVTMAGGATVVVATDGSWRVSDGPIVASDLHVGEIYDARRERDGWAAPGGDDGAWPAAALADGPAGAVVPQIGPSVEPVALVRPVELRNIGFNRAVADLGQNIAGRVRLRVEAPAGTEIVLHHGETLAPDGTVYRANLRRAYAEDRYICRGGGVEEWEPSFTIHGFRYVEVWGLPGWIAEDTITGVVLQSAMDRTGRFECSEPMVNRLLDAIAWTQAGNSVDIPTDCPQRDERLGWMCDGDVFSQTGACLRDTSGFLAKWLADVSDAAARGWFPDVAPVLGPDRVGAPGWGDAGVLVPWKVLRIYGDHRPAERLYPSITAWVDRIADANPDLVRTNDVGMDWGDWLSIPDERGLGRSAFLDSAYSTSPRAVLATAYFARVAEAAATIAGALGETGDRDRFTALRGEIVDAYRSTFVDADGRIEGETQTVYAQAIAFGLLTPAQQEAAGAHLAREVERFGGSLSVGHVGVEHLLPALASTGHRHLAYQLLLREEHPSWGSLLARGATTMWERWDGWTAEDGFADVRMNSFNHTGFGAVGYFLFHHVAGIDVDLTDPAAPRFAFAPEPGPGLTWAAAERRTPAGLVACRWQRGDGALVYELQVPPTTDAATVRLDLPAGARLSPVDAAAEDVSGGDGAALLSVGPGRHRLEVAPP